MTLKQRMERFWNSYEAGDLEQVFADLVTPDVEFVMPGAPALKGAKAVRELWLGWRSAFPDLRHQTEHAIEQDQSYAAETSFSGTHTGTLQSAQGQVPPTGKRIHWTSADVVRFRDGKIAVWHVYHDQLPLLAQLGLMHGA